MKKTRREKEMKRERSVVNNEKQETLPAFHSLFLCTIGQFQCTTNIHRTGFVYMYMYQPEADNSHDCQ